MLDNITLDRVSHEDIFDFNYLLNSLNDLDDPTTLTSATNCSYFTPIQFCSDVTSQIDNRTLSVLGLNIQSLPSHWDDFKIFLNDLTTPWADNDFFYKRFYFHH